MGGSGTASGGRERSGRAGPASAHEERFVHELTADLAMEQSGLSFVYRALEGIVKRYRLSHLVAVVDVPGADRQAFQATRKPLAQRPHDHVRDLACFAPPGLHA